MITTRKVTVSIVAAIAVHLGALMIWMKPLDTEGAIAEGRDGLQVSVGLAGSFMETPNQPTKDQKETPVEETMTEASSFAQSLQIGLSRRVLKQIAKDRFQDFAIGVTGQGLVHEDNIFRRFGPRGLVNCEVIQRMC